MIFFVDFDFVLQNILEIYLKMALVLGDSVHRQEVCGEKSKQKNKDKANCGGP